MGNSKYFYNIIMNSTKIATITYYTLFIISVAILLNVCTQINQLFSNVLALDSISNEYAELQKNAGVYGIISFIILLSVGFLLYYLTKKRTYIVLSNILYISLILYVFISANKQYYSVQNLQYSQQNEYWLTIFMGIFYIIGAVLVSAIGYITVRNYTKRISV